MTRAKILLVTGVAVLVPAAIVLGLVYVAADPEGLWLQAKGPVDAKLGQPFKLVIEATNKLAAGQIKLGDLDIDDDYLKAFSVVSVSPSPRTSRVDRLGRCTTYDFDEVLDPGETVTFEFTLQPRLAGTHRGEVDLWTGMRFVTAVVETVVSR